MINLDQAAHDYAIALINSGCEMEFDKFIQLCCNYALAMQKESEKHKAKGFPLDADRPPLKISGG